MTLRVNQRENSIDEYETKLKDAGINANIVEGLSTALTLESPVSVQSLPGFEQGHVSVQDSAAQIAANLLGESTGRRLLDACSAPGGKTAHALEQGEWQHVVALDQDADRLSRVNDTLMRLNLATRAELHCADAANTDTWWDNTPFDAILLDAPCSGTGVIRRHPDIKLLRRVNDIEKLVGIQRQLLKALWKTLAPGGRMVYATCSVLKKENEQQIRWFLNEQSDASEIALELPYGKNRSTGTVQILPGDAGMDGFFYATLEKAK